MKMEADTAALRNAAPSWNLAGDKQLLGMLQQIHQSIITKCQEANAKLDAMVDALDNASLDLQNVNNKFMALSNSQFVESRVYDDDVDIKAGEASDKQEIPKLQPESDLEKIKRSLQKLEMMHEPVLIMDSDSSDDEESSVVLKPKDIYIHRPVPHIIGSQAWKKKWHAGVLLEDSDSDSSLSKRDIPAAEEYSDSEPEVAVDVTDKHAQRTISSSSMESDVLSRCSQPPIPSPADVAAELARRLAGPAPPPIAPETTFLPPEPTTRKVYGMDKPTPATIFPTEPPPLDSYESDKYSDDDIFAELNRKPNRDSFRDANRSNLNANSIVDELFGGQTDRTSDIGRSVPDYAQPSSGFRKESPSADEDPPCSSYNEKSSEKPTSSTADVNIKKPIGGISLFGSNKGAESIGAAILKRNQRKSTSDEDESDAVVPQVQPVKETVKENKNIIEELFTKPAAKKKDKTVVNRPIDNVKSGKDKVEIKAKDKVEVKSKDKVDLFSDNIFDDIDDIFTTNVTRPKNNENTISVFDDDDLFSDVVETIHKPQVKKDTKSIFESEDELFIEKDVNVTNNETKTTLKVDTSVKTSKENAKVKSIFDDSSDDDLFADLSHKPQPISEVTQAYHNKTELLKTADSEIKSVDEDTSADDVISNKNNSNVDQITNVPNNKTTNNSVFMKQTQSPNLFDDDDDEIDDLFSINAEQKLVKTPQQNIKQIIHSTVLEDDVQNGNNVNVNKINIDSKDVSEPNVNKDIKNIKQTSVITNSDNSFDEDNFKDEIENNEIIKQNEQLETESKVVTNDKLTEPELNPKQPLVIGKITEPKEPDLFTDIFNDLPPAFEKPIESKKSKNVNALFDDDSDDEALFFKKNDVISDEKPDLDFGSDRFRIFHDEPPDIEVDFSQKPQKSTNSGINEKPNDELFNNIPQIENIESQYHKEQVTTRSNTDIHVTIENKPVKAVDITKLIEHSETETKEVNISKLLEDDPSDKEHASSNNKTNNLKSESKLEHNIQNIDNIPIEYESKDTAELLKEDDIKKPIGKLKPMTFNINVNTLIPGASPKKNKTTEETDGQIISTKSNEEINTISSNNSNINMLKSVSFDGDSDSKILDNKLSKDRARIQVKRRPSTRRARLEAVRKSGIDFGSDSTDNSSSFDEPKLKEPKDEIDSRVKEDKVTTKEANIRNIDPPTINSKIDSFGSKLEQQSINTSDKIKPEVKSKIVYILNDEDIFSNSSQNTITNQGDNAVEGSFKTIGTTYNKSSNAENVIIDKDNKRKDESKDRKPLFDDLSDEELFGDKKPSTQKTKDNLFNSDSEAELFSKSSAKSVDQKKNVARASLFGDESDDDDLFATKTSKKSDIKPIPQNQTTSKPAEVVFEDPLSMFEEDES